MPIAKTLTWLFLLLLFWNESASAQKVEESHRPWPRTLTNYDGSPTEIPSQPQRIVSTSVTITGTLLAINAPVVASATAINGRFFAQWTDQAETRGVEKLWPAGRVDLEAVYAVSPDLIIVSASGADSAKDQLTEFQTIAPTLVLDYGEQTWQQLARQIGQATGLEAQTARLLDDFDAYLADAKARLKRPEGLANIVSYNGPGAPNPIATGSSAHAQLLQALGFSIEEPDPTWKSDGNKGNDFIRAQYEHLTQLKAPSTFLLSAGDDKARQFLQDPLLSHVPSVKSGQVFGLGLNSFRIDFFSAHEIVDALVDRFAVSTTEPVHAASH